MTRVVAADPVDAPTMLAQLRVHLFEYAALLLKLVVFESTRTGYYNNLIGANFFE